MANVLTLVHPPADGEDWFPRLIGGGPEAARVLFDRGHRDVNALVASVMGPDAEHDDLVHDVFVQLLKSIHQLKSAEAFRGWVRAVTVNTLRTAIRRRRFRRLFDLLGDGDGEDERSSAQATGADAHTVAQVRRAWQLVQALPTEERLCYALSVLEGHALAEVAVALGVSISTVKRRLTDAQRRLEDRARRDGLLAELVEGRKR